MKLSNGMYFDTGLPSGFPDLLILHNGITYYTEVKTPTGKQRSDQLNFQRLLEERGFIYTVVRSVDDVKRMLNLI